MFTPAPGYETLAKTLERAHDRAAHGKGKERHANGQPFEEQPLFQIMRHTSEDFATGQALKKIIESQGFTDRSKRVNELLDVIVYLSAAIQHIER